MFVGFQLMQQQNINSKIIKCRVWIIKFEWLFERKFCGVANCYMKISHIPWSIVSQRMHLMKLFDRRVGHAML